MISAPTSYEVWTQLRAIHATPSRAHVMHMYESLASLSKGSQTISQYLEQIKSSSNQLAIAGEPLKSNEIILHALYGLSEDYYFFASLRARDTLVSFGELHEKFSDPESFLLHKPTTISNMTANYATKLSSSRNSRQ